MKSQDDKCKVVNSARQGGNLKISGQDLVR
jgi:hypothetical protein